MTNDTKYYVGDTGTLVIVDTLTDISSASAAELRVKRADGSIVTWPGVVYQTTKIKYIIDSDDFNSAGTYLLQAKVTLPSGIWLGNTTSFIITAVFV